LSYTIDMASYISWRD